MRKPVSVITGPGRAGLFLALLLILGCQAQTPARAEVIVCPANQAAEMPERLHIKLFDTAVNTGVSRAVKILQQSINELNPAASLAVDGVIGPKTRQALCGLSEAQVLAVYARRQADFYRGIVARKPSQKKFLNGWLRRAAWLPE